MNGEGVASLRDTDLFAHARDFVVGNARTLDRRLFACLFEDAPRQPVLDALRAYRNSDGGFGNALEPDKRCPDSQPVDAEVALGILDLVGASDDPMVPGLCDWLEAAADASGGLPFALPSVNDHPHAPWWRTDADPRPRAPVISGSGVWRDEAERGRRSSAFNQLFSFRNGPL